VSQTTETLTPDTYLVSHRVGHQQHGMRVDQFLKERYSRRSREQIKKAIDLGQITIKREQHDYLQIGKIKASTALVTGDVVHVLTVKTKEPEVNFNYSVIYEDEQLFVISKPPNLPVHPSGRYFFNTLLTHLKTQGLTRPLEFEEMYYLAHRIDKETSGILVLTKDKESCAHLTSQFAERQTSKAYLAICHGHTPDRFESDAPMARDQKGPIALRMVITPVEQGGLPALTTFETLSRTQRPDRQGNLCEYSLVKCFPKTGRQHQIRVHLDHLGYPIVGDKLYGRPLDESLQFFERDRLSPETEAKLQLPRHALHSTYLSFTHPVTRKKLEFHSELPEDMEKFLSNS
jgi:23S rRNA pseudouridine1911/1915/1917 synthase